MLVPDADVIGGERVKVVDFGIAKLAAEHKHPDTGKQKTSTGTTLGTATYMSPEQCRGDRELNDRTDVYALGVILYEMLTGKPPFESEGWGALVAMHIYEEPRPVQELDPAIDPALAGLVHRLLQKDPGARPSMNQLVEQLDALSLSQSLPGLKLSPLAGALPADASAPRGTEHTTMREATGQSGVVGPSHLGRRLRLALLLGGAAATAAGVWLAPWRARQPAALPPVAAVPARAPAATPPAATASAGVSAAEAPAPTVAPPAPVRWSVTSVPAGAQVLRAADRQVVGVTPWQLEQAPGKGKVGFVLHESGFAEKEVELDRSSSSASHQILAPLRGSDGASASAGRKAKRPGRGGTTADPAPVTSAAATTSTPPPAAERPPPAVSPPLPPPAAAEPELPKKSAKSKAHPAEKLEKAADDEFLP